MAFDIIIGWVIVIIQLISTLFFLLSIVILIYGLSGVEVFGEVDGSDFVEAIFYIIIFVVFGTIIIWLSNKLFGPFVFAYNKLNEIYNPIILYFMGNK